MLFSDHLEKWGGRWGRADGAKSNWYVCHKMVSQGDTENEYIPCATGERKKKQPNIKLLGQRI